MRGESISRFCHWLGLALAIPVAVLAIWFTFTAWREPDLYERNALWGIVMFAPVAALALYVLVRVIGRVIRELVD